MIYHPEYRGVRLDIYAREHELVSYEKGSHEIDGDRLFVNVVEYTTTTAEERFWEAHRPVSYTHLISSWMLCGTHQIFLDRRSLSAVF